MNEQPVLNPNQLEKALKAWRQSSIAPAELLTLSLLQDQQSQHAKNLKLYQLVEQTVSEQLQFYRAFVNIQIQDLSNKEALLYNLAQDFSHDTPELEVWSALYHKFLSPLSLKMSELASVAHLHERQFHRRYKLGLNKLVDKISQLEHQAKQAQQKVFLLRHVPYYQEENFVGITDITNTLVDRIMASSQTVFSLEGLGGIGKTSLVKAILLHLLTQNIFFIDICWLTVDYGESLQVNISHSQIQRILEQLLRQLIEQLNLEHLIGLSIDKKVSALHALFVIKPYLVVVDNIETFDIAQLVIEQLVSPKSQTKFILTSRYRLDTLDDILSFTVPELSLPYATELIKNELWRRKQQIDAQVIERIYESVGGIPLALKLTTSQLSRFPLHIVLHGLAEAKQTKPTVMYKRIYYRTWQTLSIHAKTILASFVLVSSQGETLDWIQMMSDLPEIEFLSALEEIIEHSLLEVSGSLKQPSYRLHRLTALFLQTQLSENWLYE